MAKPRKRITAPRTPAKGEASVLDRPDIRDTVREMAFNGYFDSEIAARVGVAKSTFCEKKQKDSEFAELLTSARARAKEGETELPSTALFREVWGRSDGKRTKLMENFGIGWSTLQSWLAQEPKFVDIMAERDLKFLEQADIAGRILALGAVKDQDIFPGWGRHPDTWMMRYYMNTLGRRYGYGENPVMPEMAEAAVPDVSQGIDIEEWIVQEMTAKRNMEAAAGEGRAAGKEVGDDTEP